MKRILCLFALIFCITSCEECFYSNYTAYNNSSYMVEFTIDGDYRTLNPGKSFTEKRYTGPDVILLNDVPVKVFPGFARVRFEDLIETTYTLNIYNSLNETIIIIIDNQEFEIASYSTINVILNSNTVSDLYLKDKPAYKVQYTNSFENDIYYIRIY